MERGDAAHAPKPARHPGLRTPPRPNRADDVLESFRSDDAKTVECDTEAEAEQVKSEIKATYLWLNRHEFNPETPGEKYNLRCRPYITEHYQLDGDATFFANEVDDKTQERWRKDGHTVRHFWQCNYQVHPPKQVGFAVSSKEVFDEALKNSAAARGAKQPGAVRRKRTVAVRRPNLPMAASPGPLIIPGKDPWTSGRRPGVFVVSAGQRLLSDFLSVTCLWLCNR